MQNLEWQTEKEQYCKGWHTWNNDSVLSYIKPLEGIGLRLCIKDYKNAAFLENALIGENEAQVIPRAHAYDDSYTELQVNWKENHFQVISMAEEGRLCVYVRCDDARIKPSSLIIQGLSLYNIGALVEKTQDGLLLVPAKDYTDCGETISAPTF